MHTAFAIVGFLLALIDFTDKTGDFEKLLDSGLERLTSFTRRATYHHGQVFGRIYANSTYLYKYMFIILAIIGGMVAIIEAMSGSESRLSVVVINLITIISFLSLLIFCVSYLFLYGLIYIMIVLRAILKILDYPRKGIVGSTGLILAAIGLFS